MNTILSASNSEIEVVAQARDGDECLEQARRHAPDVVLMDIRMPSTGGLVTIPRLRELSPPPQVIVLTTFDVDEYVYAALRGGAAGFLLKDTPPTELIHAIWAVAAGDAMLSPRVTRQVIAEFTSRQRVGRAERAKLESLTARERGVLELVAAGHANSEIAARLHMSEATVKSHISRVLAKLDAANRVQAAILAHDAGVGSTRPA